MTLKEKKEESINLFFPVFNKTRTFKFSKSDTFSRTRKNFDEKKKQRLILKLPVTLDVVEPFERAE